MIVVGLLFVAAVGVFMGPVVLLGAVAVVMGLRVTTMAMGMAVTVSVIMAMLMAVLVAVFLVTMNMFMGMRMTVFMTVLMFVLMLMVILGHCRLLCGAGLWGSPLSPWVHRLRP
ncbi:hypothetical protein Tel_13855 [Candidatus Tenderia electrophaga]|jgi:uncharacterized membrane protein YGL010W|uniref:Uncharacterized protein n=1 Tax=Candidatus Tenderia electrophaga TaxID=1748243 RepID=A0A0S2TG78_9GAMM|nr:hypothetical protein Tel_13855 [Candidatus Tenderia electrophaga]